MTITIKCLNCNKDVVIFASRLGRTKYCSRSCFVSQQSKEVLARERSCNVCGNKFIPRKRQIDMGWGKYCSAYCRGKAVEPIMNSPENRKKSYETAKKNGFIAARKMLSHENTLKMYESKRLTPEQRKENANNQLRAYRKANPEKVREWSQKRRKSKTGRLPNGTVINIYNRQKGKCVACKCDLPKNYHTDHIIPISRGGGHVPINIQLLCPSCNVRKSAKDPIKFMQERGFLI